MNNQNISEEERQNLEQCIVRQRQKLTQIADLALAAEAKSNNANVRLGSKYLDNSKAIAEIRRICKLDIVDEIAPDYEWLARIMTGEHFEPECLAKAIEAVKSNNPNNPNNRTIPTPDMKRGKGRLFKSKHNSSCHGTYIYDRICINDAHIRAALHPDNGGLEQHATIWIGDSQRCFCYCTFNTTSTVKCDYVVSGMIAGLAKRLVYHHNNLIKRRAKWAAAMAAQKDGK